MMLRSRFPRGVLFVVTVSAAGVASLLGCRADFGGITSGTTGGSTSGGFKEIQIDPRSEDSAGPQFVASDDLNGDGFPDVVAAWNQSQPIQIHLQRRDALGAISFETLPLAGNVPAVAVAGLAIADFDRDGRADVAVLVKESLLGGAACLDSEQPGDGLSGSIVLYLGPDDPAQANQAFAWQEVVITSSLLQGVGTLGGTSPEEGGFTSLKIGDMDLDGDMDIVVAWNSDCGGGTQDAVIFTNNGPGAVRDGSWTGVRIPDEFPKGGPIKDLALADIDLDGDLDIVTTFPDAAAMNVRWYRNPAVDVPDVFHVSDGGWQVGLIGQLATGADTLVVGDLDRDGVQDVVVRSGKLETGSGGVIQWFRGTVGATTSPLPSIPWQVFTIAEFSGAAPDAITLGDVNLDGRDDLIVSVGASIAWFDGAAVSSVFDQWRENLIVSDNSSTGTLVNSITVVDLDGDRVNDVVATVDRSSLSGLSNDALSWFKNTRVAR